MPTPLFSREKKAPPPPTRPKPNQKLLAADRNVVDVYGRLRPLKNFNDKVIVTKLDDENLKIFPPPPLIPYFFKFRYIFDSNSSQQEVFNHVAIPLVRDLIHGKNGLIFTYGVTGSGKTHTIVGNPQDCGLLPRVLDMIFNTLDKNNLQSVPFIFKPDAQNGFDIVPPPDALQKIQNNLLICQAQSSPLNRRKRCRSNEIDEWEGRVKENSFVKDINHDLNYAVFVTYVEIYNNYIYDLLDDQLVESGNGARGPRPKKILEDGRKRYYVHGAKEIEVKSADEACELFIIGSNRRKTGMTEMNNESSRSHSVFTVRIVRAPLDREGLLPIQNKRLINVSQLSIVDLAGCERAGKTKATGNRLKEANNINNSLLTLRKCFDLLRENQKGANNLIPYRDSKLTHLFKSYFEGDGKVKMIICINPGLEDYDETIQVCKFAETSQELTTFQSPTTKISKFKSSMSNINYSSLMPTNEINFPNDFLSDPEDNITIPKWIEFLNKRYENHATYMDILRQNQMVVRSKIIETGQQSTLSRHECQELKVDLEYREAEKREYQMKCTTLESEIIKLSQDNQKLLDENNRLKEKSQKLDEKIASLESELIKKNQYQKRCEARMKEFHQIRKILINDIKEKEREKIKNLLSRLCDAALGSEASEMSNSTSLSSLNSRDYRNISNSKSKTPELRRTENGPNEIYNYIDPHASKHAVVANPKHRRSLSTSPEKYINHHPSPKLSLGTVLQPVLKNCKSVSKLKASDLIDHKKCLSKYVLTHHETDETGCLETKIFKGNIIPSSSGGAQVIFNDIELLKQESPTKFLSK